MLKKAKATYVVVAVIVLGFFVLTVARETGRKSGTPNLPVGSEKPALALGANDEGQLPPALPQATAIFAGQTHGLYLDLNGDVYAWGGNEIHQVSSSEEKIVKIPMKVDLPGKATAISTSHVHTLGLVGGDVYAWGYNYTGQLGTGDNQGQKLPKKVEGLPKVLSVAAGYKFSLALTQDGDVYAWGAKCADPSERALLDFAATLSDSTSYFEPVISNRVRTAGIEDCLNESIVGIESKSPKKLNDTGFAEISAGYGHGVLRKDDGSVWTFGCNWFGQLGNRGTSNELRNSVIQKVDGLEAMIAVSAGFRHSLALSGDGKVYEWGGKVTDGGEVERTSALRQISGLPAVIKIVAGKDYSLALTRDGDLYGWGANSGNIFGTGKAVVLEPTKLGSDISLVAAGQNFIVATAESTEQ